MSRWTTQELLTRLAVSFGADNVEEVPTADGAIQVTLPDSGDLGITIALTDREIFVSTPWSRPLRSATRPASTKPACA
ncbi:hypothetical protein [Lysobacter gummosus]|uniref:hypothetical protein n=1 Tax=Lysobacter gummosus TaxID=262324 RepID=UPI00363C3ABC